MAKLSFRSCMAWLAASTAIAAITTTADNNFDPVDGYDVHADPAVPNPALVMANMIVNVDALVRYRSTEAESSPAGAEPVQPGFVLMSSMDHYVESIFERREILGATIPRGGALAKLYDAWAAGARVEVVQAYPNGACERTPSVLIFWGNGQRAEDVVAKTNFGSFRRSLESLNCELACSP